jgi:N-acetylmuramoyl-L-alanine amidase
VTLGSTAPVPRAPARLPKSKPAAKPAEPEITEHPIPFDAQRVQETAAYSRRHYGRSVTRLDPKIIVEHYTATATAQAAFDSFARDVPDVELHELPGVCSHFVVDRDGTIFQLVPLRLICRHTVGLNDVAIGIEHVGSTDAEVLNNSPQLKASLRLTTWLRCRYGISTSNVIGHAESLSSPYHHENVAAVRTQTHPDFQPRSMNRYRSLLRQRTC